MSTETAGKAARLIGVQHRRKTTKEGEARPTIVSVCSDTGTKTHKLESDMDELDFVHGKLPTEYRDVVIGEDLSSSEPHHIIWRKSKKDETLEKALETWPKGSLQTEHKGRGKSKIEILTGIPEKVACKFEGLRDNDFILGIFGGSGKDFVIALINKASELQNTKVFLTAPRNLKNFRDTEHAEKESDSELLVRLYQKSPELFHEMFPTDAETWEVMHLWDMTAEAMGQRKKVAQRAEQFAHHEAYTQKSYLGSKLAQEILRIKSNNQTLQQVEESESEAQKLLVSSVENHPLYKFIFEGIKGCGPRGFAKILSGIMDIRRFPREGIGAFLRFCGYASEKGENGNNTIQRFRRGGKGSPFNPEVKQAIWLLIDMQFSRQGDGDDTPWGKRFREIKAGLWEKHPFPELHCDTEIPLLVGNHVSNKDVSEITVTFAKGKEHKFKGGKIEEGGGKKILVVPKEVIHLHEGKWEVSNGLYTVKMPDGSVIHRPGKSRYTKVHMHKITGWKLGTEFCVHIFKKWWEFVDMQEAARKTAEQKAA